MSYLSYQAAKHFHRTAPISVASDVHTIKVCDYTKLIVKDGYITLEIYGKPIAKRQLGCKSYFVCTQGYTNNLVLSRLRSLWGMGYLTVFDYQGLPMYKLYNNNVEYWDGDWKLIIKT